MFEEVLAKIQADPNDLAGNISELCKITPPNPTLLQKILQSKDGDLIGIFHPYMRQSQVASFSEAYLFDESDMELPLIGFIERNNRRPNAQEGARLYHQPWTESEINDPLNLMIKISSLFTEEQAYRIFQRITQNWVGYRKAHQESLLRVIAALYPRLLEPQKKQILDQFDSENPELMPLLIHLSYYAKSDEKLARYLIEHIPGLMTEAISQFNKPDEMRAYFDTIRVLNALHTVLNPNPCIYIDQLIQSPDFAQNLSKQNLVISILDKLVSNASLPQANNYVRVILDGLMTPTNNKNLQDAAMGFFIGLICKTEKTEADEHLSERFFNELLQRLELHPHLTTITRLQALNILSGNDQEKRHKVFLFSKQFIALSATLELDNETFSFLIGSQCARANQENAQELYPLLFVKMITSQTKNFDSFMQAFESMSVHLTAYQANELMKFGLKIKYDVQKLNYLKLIQESADTSSSKVKLAADSVNMFTGESFDDYPIIKKFVENCSTLNQSELEESWKKFMENIQNLRPYVIKGYIEYLAIHANSFGLASRFFDFVVSHLLTYQNNFRIFDSMIKQLDVPKRKILFTHLACANEDFTELRCKLAIYADENSLAILAQNTHKKPHEMSLIRYIKETHDQLEAKSQNSNERGLLSRLFSGVS